MTEYNVEIDAVVEAATVEAAEQLSEGLATAIKKLSLLDGTAYVTDADVGVVANRLPRVAV